MLRPELLKFDSRSEARLIVGCAIIVKLLDPLAADEPAAHDACERLLEGLAGLEGSRRAGSNLCRSR